MTMTIHRKYSLFGVLVTCGTLVSCTFNPTSDPCRPHDMIPTLQIPFEYAGPNGSVSPSCSIDERGVVTMQYTPLSCSADVGWWGGCTIAANQDLKDFDASSGGGRGIIAMKVCVKDFVPSALNLRYGSPAFTFNGRTKFMPLITTGESFTGSGCRLVYLSPEDACYGFNRCGVASGCVTDTGTAPGNSCDTFTRSQLIVINEFCVEPRPAAMKPTVVTIERMTYYPEQCLCNDTESCAAPNVCRRDGWLSESKCQGAGDECRGVCAP